jgi:predicted  nucleic acid-binding Zn-ribbon protein
LQVNPDLRNLINLQDIDQKIINFRKQISEIPNKTQAFQAELQQLTQAHQQKVALGQELAKQRRVRENDVEMMRTRLARLKDQLMTVKTNKEYTAMLHEIQAADDHIRAAEDEILAIMEQTEAMEDKSVREAVELTVKEAELRDQVKKSELAIPALEADVSRLCAEKIALESIIGQELLGRYRRIAEARKGMALAEAKDELCSACHVRIRPQVLADLLRTEEIHVCDSCSRILFIRESF